MSWHKLLKSDSMLIAEELDRLALLEGSSGAPMNQETLGKIADVIDSVLDQPTKPAEGKNK